jgi:hypothetical protein
MSCQQAHIANARRAGEDRLEEAPTIVRRASEIHGKLTKNATLSRIAGIRHECSA